MPPLPQVQAVRATGGKIGIGALLVALIAVLEQYLTEYCPVEQLRRSMDSASAVTLICERIGEKSFANTANQVDIASAGGIPLLLTVMQHHADHPGVIEAACVAVTGVTAFNADNQASIALAGGIP